MVLAASHDGVIVASAHRYGAEEGNTTGSLELTFNEAITSSRNNSYLFIVDAANHFTLAYPKDNTTGRSFIDQVTTRPDEELRHTILQLITQPTAPVTNCSCK